jgi:hypothetical protein
VGGPTLEERARHALHLQALPPMAATTAAPHADGCRPKRRGAAARAQGGTLFRPHTAAPSILAGDREGVVDPLAFPWLEPPLPRPKRLRATGLRRGCGERGPLLPTPAGVPPGGIMAPGISHRVLDGLESVVPGGHGHRRVPQINAVRGAADFMVTAHARDV